MWKTTAASLRLLPLLALLLSPPSAADSMREIQWDDLLPGEVLALDEQALVLREKLFALDESKRKDYQRVARQLVIRDKLAMGGKRADLGDADREILEDDPVSRLPEAVAYWEEYMEVQERVDAANEAISPALDGQRVRMPGYLLPLDFDGTKVREFLLVPYVGACIHTPPPPRNQMVFVRADGDVESNGLYDPVWVEGTMSTEGGSHSLELIDGSSNVEAGYTLRATKVEPYDY